MFVCFVQIEKLSLISRGHHCWWRAPHFDLCSALMTIRQWGLFYVQHPLWHGTSDYNGNIRGPLILVPNAKRFASGAVNTCLNDLSLPQLGFEHPTFRLRGQRSNQLRHHRSHKINWFWYIDHTSVQHGNMLTHVFSYKYMWVQGGRHWDRDEQVLIMIA